MAISFDYTATDVDDDTVRKIAAEMSDGDLKPLSDEDRLKREAWRAEQAFLAQERQAERDRQQAELRSAARHEEALALAERNRVAREKAAKEYSERAARRSRENDLAAIRYESQQQGQWRRAVQHDLRAQHVQSLYGELEKMLSPPPPPPEPVVINQPDDDLGSPNIGDDNFNPGYWLNKPIFKR